MVDVCDVAFDLVGAVLEWRPFDLGWNGLETAVAYENWTEAVAEGAGSCVMAV